jgi:hypothetical protein
MQAKELNKNMTDDTCKIMWLRACAAFPDHTVVPRSISCAHNNFAVCNMEVFYSNCENDDHCASIPDVNAGAPAADATWPRSSSAPLAKFKPCCSFYTQYNCEGALESCSEDTTGSVMAQMVNATTGEITMVCPVTHAQEKGFCSSEAPCYNIGAGGMLSPPIATTLTASLLMAAVLFQTGP